MHQWKYLKIIRETKENDKNYDVIQNVVSEFIENLSIGIVNLINIFEPQVIGIGGSFIHFEDVFLERLIKSVHCEMGDSPFIPIIRPAVLGNDAGIIGATL